MARILRGSLLAAWFLVVTGCNPENDHTFVVDELSILSVQMQPSELVFNLEELEMLPITVFPYTHLYMRALAVNPEHLGGQDAIEGLQWSIGDPPIEGSIPIVTSEPEITLTGEALLPALAFFGKTLDQYTPAELAETLRDGPLEVPIVVTAITADDSATAVKLLTVRGVEGWDNLPNENPSAEALGIGERDWTSGQLDNLSNTVVTPAPPAAGRQAEFDITVDPDDDGKDGDVDSTMYTTAGHIYWSANSMRTWNLTTPGDDYVGDSFRVFVVLRDPDGAQSWLTIEQTLLY
jgi:hypothetical protein